MLPAARLLAALREQPQPLLRLIPLPRRPLLQVPITITKTQRPCVYDFNGRQLHLKQQNGALVARVGGGYQELWAILSKLLVPGYVRPAVQARRTLSISSSGVGPGWA